MSNIESQTGYYFYAFLLTFWNGKFNSSCPSYCSHYGCSSQGSRANLFLTFLVSSPVSLTLHPPWSISTRRHTHLQCTGLDSLSGISGFLN